MSTRTRSKRHRVSRLPHTPGFTLIEIMVVLALTLVMMAAFAQIFSMTGTFVTKQKGVGENDQSARIVTTILKTDLEARTMRLLAPFHPNMSTASLAAFASNQQGYFYVSENDPTDDTDDVLQFTIGLNATGLTALNNPAAGGQMYGAALFLATPWVSGANYGPGALIRPSSATKNTAGFVFKNKGAAFTSGGTEPTWPTTLTTVADGAGTWTALASPVDQPDGDDGSIAYDALGNRTLDPTGGNPNNTGGSQYAEVTYFLRHGNLYRRVLLIRQPYDLGGQTDAQPYDTDTPATSMIPGVYPNPSNAVSGNFWTDFDYSARIQPPTGAAPATGVQFLGVLQPPGFNSLDNTNAAGALPASLPIGRPDNRFGFDQTFVTTGGPVANGAPREFAFQYNSAANSVTGSAPALMFFFGRYTQEETSNLLFQFPGNLPTVPTGSATTVSPMGSNTLLGLDSTSYTMWMLDATPTPTAPVSLAGGARRGEDILLTNVVSFDVKLWDPHYSETTVAYDVNRNGVIDNGPAFADIGHVATGDFQQSKNIFPVYGPRIDTGYAVPAAPLWAPAFTRTVNTTLYNYNNVFDTWYPFFNFDNLARTYDAADAGLFYAPAPYRPRAGATWTAGATYAVGALVDPLNTANGYVYQCTAITSGVASGTEPFSLSDTVGGTITDNGVTWTVMPPLGVKAIQITVKYLDPTQNLLRQVTIVQSLTQ
ncbi:MAG TPA: prepilin-type N-terminal cleavage/methylation domain-containing protein [Planctomycetaceae bacterium]|jgi:prepilin-type N-terminal cleavage/methylation domain-containing protein|nr:prepilin-type N-terminal cleavage/methylation domain-containing protein [Planctomycetaceae bacterium]